MSTRWTDAAWHDPEVEYRPLPRRSLRTTLECVAVLLVVPVLFWGALAAYLLGWL